METCSNPGCNQPGTNKCSACKITVYCCVICQTADWTHHKEECPGHLRNVVMANLFKAKGFYDGRNWMQALRYGELAATKLKQLKDRSLETVRTICLALGCKFDALVQLDRQKEALECIKECYSLWAMNHMRNPETIYTMMGLIQSCIHNNEFEDAEHYARHAYFMIAEMTANFIPANQRSMCLAEGSYYLSRAIFHLAEASGFPSEEEKKKTGVEAIELARKAIVLYTPLCGNESAKVAMATGSLADVLEYFNDVDDDEIPHLIKQSIAVYRRLEGNASMNVFKREIRLAYSYRQRANRAKDANDLDRSLANLELAMSHLRETARIARDINHAESIVNAHRGIAEIEESIRRTKIAKATAAVSKKS